MSRYTGPQQRGAERVMRAERRRQAEARQADERSRYARRAAELAAPPRPLTDDERTGLIHAVNVLKMAQILDDLKWLRGGA